MICRILKVSAGRSEHRGAPPHGAQPPRGAPSTNCNLWVLLGRISAYFFYQINSPVHVGSCQSQWLPSATLSGYYGNDNDYDERRGTMPPLYSNVSSAHNEQSRNCVGTVNQQHLFTQCVVEEIRPFSYDSRVGLTI